MSEGQTHIDLTNEEIELVRETIANFEIGGPVRDLLARSRPCAGGRRISGTDQQLDDLWAAVEIEVRGFTKVDSETVGRALKKPRPGTTASRLQVISEKIEAALS